MMEARPAMLGISGSDGGHLVICDGYNSDEDTYHLNFGWNGGGDGWYSLPAGMPFGFNVINAAIINIDSPSQGANDTPHQDFIFQNFPNPFSSSTTVSFNLATSLRYATPRQAENAQVTIYNIKGQLIKTLIPMTNDQCPMTKVVWDGKDESGKPVASGIYFYRLSTRGESASGGKLGDKVIDTKKCLLLK